MEIILKDDIKGLGYKNDVVDVKPGYGRNYLLPKGLAVLATTSARKVVAENIKQAAHKAEKIKTEAINTAAKIGENVLEIKQKVGDNGKIFGKITSLQIADALKSLGVEVDRRRISFNESDVKSVGEYTANIDLHKEVKHSVKFVVVAE